MIHLHKDLYLTADPSQFVLFHKSVAKKGKNIGKEIISKKTYYPSIDQLMVRLFHETLFDELSDEKQKDLKFLVKRFKKLSKVVKVVSDKIGNTKHLYTKMTSENSEPLGEEEEIMDDEEEIMEDEEEIMEDDEEEEIL